MAIAKGPPVRAGAFRHRLRARGDAMGLTTASDQQPPSFSTASTAAGMPSPGRGSARTTTALRRICGLTSLGLFEGLSSTDLQQVAETATIRGFERGDVVLRGDAPRECVILLQGRASMSKPRGVANGELGLGLFGQGDLISASCWAGPGRAMQSDVVALESSVVAFLPRRTLDPLIERYPALAIRLLEAVAKRLHHVMDLATENSCLDIADRLYRRLAELSATRGLALPDGRVVIDHGLRQSELAASIGASRESVNRQFALWKAQGVIESAHNQVLVANLQRWSMAVSNAVRETVFPTADCRSRCP